MPFISFQKSPPVNFDQLPVPLFETEAKRLAAAATKVVKPQSVNHVESGTSVAPRQRPKGSSAVNPQKPLGLGLPPSPSPRTNITSPQPQKPIVEQFQANFPSIAPVAPTADPAVTSTSKQPTEIGGNTTIIPNAEPEVLKKLFDSSGFPDPFSEASPNLQQPQPAENVACATANVFSPNNPPLESPAAAAAVRDNVGDQLLSPPKNSSHINNLSGHRRNVSDTSAFNK